MKEKETVIIGQRLICEYVEQPNNSCDGCDLKGCSECCLVECQSVFTGKNYILKILETIRC